MKGNETWMGILDLETGLIHYANAGHNPPVIRHKDGTYEYLKGKSNFTLGGMEGVRYREMDLGWMLFTNLILIFHLVHL